MDEISLFLTIVMLGLSGLLFVVSFASWYRLRKTKLIIVSFAFIAFFIKAILLIAEIIVQDEKVVIIDTIILVLFYFSVIKK